MWIKAGYGESVITPPLGVELAGYGYFLERKCESVRDDLKARAVYVRAGDSAALLVSCDLIGFSIADSDRLRADLAREAGIAREAVLLACTHTHTGPATSDMRGVGVPDADYMAKLPGMVVAAVRAAIADASDAEFLRHREIVEPIGFNRRHHSFSPVDPGLKIAMFRRAAGDILLLSYSCHPVMLGRATAVSADWPGAAVRAIESRGARAMVSQGFLGDIDPVTNMNRWGQATDDDLDLYGRLIATHALKAAKYGSAPTNRTIVCREKRISLPLVVPRTRDEIVVQWEEYRRQHSAAAPAVARFYDDWGTEAVQRHESIAANPFCHGVPIIAMQIGGMNIIGIPGEVDCVYGLKLAANRSPLLNVGLAGGVLSYLPSREAYDKHEDYACYQAAKIYGTLFPFANDIEDIILSECDTLLAQLQAG